MKQLFRNPMMLTLIAAAIAGCLGYYLGSSEQWENNTIHGIVNDTDTELDTISSAQSAQWITNYGVLAGKMASILQTDPTANPDNLPADSFLGGAGWTIPMDDIYKHLRRDNTKKYVRAYLAYDSLESSGNLHLILAIVNNMHTSKCNAGQDSIMNYYFDLVTPCPQVCDVNSSLYKSYLKGVQRTLNGYNGCNCN